MSFIDRNVFRVDVNAIRRDTEAELIRRMQQVIELERAAKDLDVIDEPIPLIQAFPLYHKTKSFLANEGLSSLIKIEIPQDKVGFLSAIGTTFLQNAPNSYFQILIDDRFIDGYSEADGKISRQIGDLLIPRPLIPPIVFQNRIELKASNEGNILPTTSSLGFTIEGLIMDKPPFAGQGAIITADNVVKLIRRQRGSQNV